MTDKIVIKLPDASDTSGDYKAQCWHATCYDPGFKCISCAFNSEENYAKYKEQELSNDS